MSKYQDIGPAASWQMWTQRDEGTVYDTATGRQVDGWVSGGANGYYADEASKEHRFWEASRFIVEQVPGGEVDMVFSVGGDYHTSELSAAQSLYDRHRRFRPEPQHRRQELYDSPDGWGPEEWDGAF